MTIDKTVKLESLSNEDLKDVQTRLNNMGLESGQADGLFGIKTLSAWHDFKKQFHIDTPEWLDFIGLTSYELLKQESDRGTSKVHNFVTRQGAIDAIRWECIDKGLPLKSQIAYVLATVKHETNNTFQPINEIGGNAYFTKLYEGRNDLGNTQKGDGARFKGRGYVQITGRRNYTRYSEIIGVDLISKPEMVREPNIALFILVHGFKNGIFTGRNLETYINKDKTDFMNARRCINGTDKATLIASYANAFLGALKS